MSIYSEAWNDLDNTLAVYYDESLFQQLGGESMMNRSGSYFVKEKDKEGKGKNVKKQLFFFKKTNVIEINKEVQLDKVLEGLNSFKEMWNDMVGQVDVGSLNRDRLTETGLFIFGVYKKRKKGYTKPRTLYGLGKTFKICTPNNEPTPFALTKAMNATISMIPMSDVDSENLVFSPSMFKLPKKD